MKNRRRFDLEIQYEGEPGWTGGTGYNTLLFDSVSKHFFLANGEYNKVDPKSAKPISIIEALSWYAKIETAACASSEKGNSVGSTGTTVRLARAAAKAQALKEKIEAWLPQMKPSRVRIKKPVSYRRGQMFGQHWSRLDKIPRDISISESEYFLLSEARRKMIPYLSRYSPKLLRLTTAAILCSFELRTIELEGQKVFDSLSFAWPVDDRMAANLSSSLRIPLLAAQAATAWLQRARHSGRDRSWYDQPIIVSSGFRPKEAK